MKGLAPRRQTKNEEGDPYDRPQKGEKGYIKEELVRHVRNQRLASSDLLKKYEYQYQQCLQHESEEEEYERRTRKSLKKQEYTRDRWHCPFFKYCWDSGMSRLPGVRIPKARCKGDLGFPEFGTCATPARTDSTTTKKGGLQRRRG
jgi:hypothetical protein